MALIRIRCRIRSFILYAIALSYIYTPFRGGFNDRFNRTTNPQLVHTTDQDHHLLSLPIEPKLIKIYHIFSTLINTLSIIKFLLLNHYGDVSNQWDSKHAPHCYIPGRLTVGPFGTFSFLPILLAGFNLTWRCFQWSKSRTFKLDALYFVFQDYPQSLRDKFPEVFITNHKLIDRSSASGGKNCGGQLNEQILSLFYYRIDTFKKVVLRLRPNRTHSARDRLIGASVTVMKIGLILGAVFASLGYIPYGLFDGYYVQNYSSCDTSLEQKLLVGEVNYYSISLTGHKMFVFPFDLLENLIVWLDITLGIITNSVLILILDYDAKQYWGIVQKRLVRLQDRLNLESSLSRLERFIDQCNYKYLLTNSTGTDGRPKLIYVSLNDLNRTVKRVAKDTDATIKEVQAEICDLFKLIREIDSYASETMSAAIIYWLAIMTTISYLSMNLTSSDDIFRVRFMQFLALLVLLICCTFLIGIQRATSSTYRVLCSIMAHDKSRHKARFMSLMGYYTKKQQPSYTLFHQHPMSPITMLSISSWTITSILINESLFRNHRPVTGLNFNTLLQLQPSRVLAGSNVQPN